MHFFHSESKCHDQRLSVCIYGQVGSGRRSLARRLSENRFEDDLFNSSPQSHIPAKIVNLPSQQPVRLVFDIAAASERLGLEKVSPSSIQHADILLLTLDLSQDRSFAGLKNAIDNIRQQFSPAKILCVGTKADCCAIPKAELNRKLNGIELIETSAKSDKGISSDLLNALQKAACSIVESSPTTETSCVIL